MAGVSGSILTSIEFQMSLLLFVAFAGYLVASRINQSAVIGEILVGLLIGPSVFNLITLDNADFVRAIAHMGAIILLFVIGLEFKLKDLMNPKYAVIGVFGVVVPWIAGYFLAVWFGFSFGHSLFIGTAMTATSIAITANVLKEMGKLQTRAARAIIGAAVVDDILALMALSATINLAQGSFSMGNLFFILGKSFGFLVVGVVVGYVFLRKAMMKLDRSELAQKFPEMAFIFAMMVAFMYGTGAELMGLSAIIGAFVAGVALEGVDLAHSRSFKEEAESLEIIFASIFFVSLGILADLKALNAHLLWFAIVLSVVAVLTKLIGCGIPARIMGMDSRDSLIIGFGMAPRAEVAMIVGLIGLNHGLIGQDIYVTLVVMALLTTVIVPPIYRKWFYPPKAS